MDSLSASANAVGGSIDVTLTDLGDATMPARQVVRRRLSFPATPTDGLLVADYSDLFVPVAADGTPSLTPVPWGDVERLRYLVVNSVTEGGLLQAEIATYAPQGASAAPTRVVVRIWDGSAVAVAEIGSVTEVVTAGGITKIYTSASPTDPVGTVAISGSSLMWTAGGNTISVGFDLEELQSTLCTVDPAKPSHMIFTTSVAQTILRTIIFDQSVDANTGEWTRILSINDREADSRDGTSSVGGLTPGTTYYYVAFPEPDPLTASATATGTHGYGDRLYGLLPEVDRYYDEPTPDLEGTGQLRRFLKVFGAGLDQARDLGEGLLSLHDVLQVNAAYLPRLSRWLGWDPDLTQPEGLQRNDILFAPEIFRSVGTLPTCSALVNRMSGWPCRFKEFFQNVFLTNAAEPVRLWQLCEAVSSATSTLSNPTPQVNIYPPSTEAAVTQDDPDAFDARPAAAVDSSGTVWLVWHSQRLWDGVMRRRVWFQRLGIDATPINLVGDLPDSQSFVDETPSVLFDGTQMWFFWSSNRSGSVDIWARSAPASSGSNARKAEATKVSPQSPNKLRKVTAASLPSFSDPRTLTEDGVGDRSPSAVRDAAGTIWVFFESDRRGPTDIWAATSTDEGASWSRTRITTANLHDRAPAAVLDAADVVRLFYSSDTGDGCKISQGTFEGTDWTFEDITTSIPCVRDESPAAVVWKKAVWLFWHSNRSGPTSQSARFRIWSASETGQAFGAPAPILARLSNDEQPAVVVDDSDSLHLYFTSQQSGARFRSRTVGTLDTSSTTPLDATEQAVNTLTLGSIGKYDDRLHYTYDTRFTTNGSYQTTAATGSGYLANVPTYARGQVGIYLMPSGGTTDLQNSQTAARVRALVKRFQPLPVQLIWYLTQTNGAQATLFADETRSLQTQGDGT